MPKMSRSITFVVGIRQHVKALVLSSVLYTGDIYGNIAIG